MLKSVIADLQQDGRVEEREGGRRGGGYLCSGSTTECRDLQPDQRQGDRCLPRRCQSQLQLSADNSSQHQRPGHSQSSATLQSHPKHQGHLPYPHTLYRL